MASAAAVGANAADEPVQNDIGEAGDIPGEITSGIYATDEKLPDVNGNVEDSDEDLPANPLKGRRAARRANNDDEDGGELDLFGDDKEEEALERDKPA